MWEFLFGKRKKDILKQETVNVEAINDLPNDSLDEDSFESRLKSELARREELRKVYANLIEFRHYITSAGWVKEGNHWYRHDDYPMLWLHDRHELFSLVILGMRHDLEIFCKTDTGLIAKLEDALATYKRVTAEVGTN